MRKHPNKAVNKYPYTIAAYPLDFHKYVISPKKICMQFKGVQCKLRAPYKDSADLKRTSWGSKEMPIDTKATDINVLALGVPLDLYPELIKQMLTALKEHAEIHPENSILDEIQEIIDGQ